jgi:hypothetical protein
LFWGTGKTGLRWFDRLGKKEPSDAVLELEPEPRHMLDGEPLGSRHHGGGGLL